MSQGKQAPSRKSNAVSEVDNYIVVFQTKRGWKINKTSKHGRESASSGSFPGCAPFGYWSDNKQQAIVIDVVEAAIVTRVFELCAGGRSCLLSISRAVHQEFGVRVSIANVAAILHDCFYLGIFFWDGRWYLGTQPVFLRRELFYQAHAVLNDATEEKTGSTVEVENMFDAQ